MAAIRPTVVTTPRASVRMSSLPPRKCSGTWYHADPGRSSKTPRHARTASTMLKGQRVGTTRDSLSPARLKSAANSSFVRSLPVRTTNHLDVEQLSPIRFVVRLDHRIRHDDATL